MIGRISSDWPVAWAVIVTVSVSFGLFSSASAEQKTNNESSSGTQNSTAVFDCSVFDSSSAYCYLMDLYGVGNKKEVDRIGQIADSTKREAAAEEYLRDKAAKNSGLRTLGAFVCFGGAAAIMAFPPEDVIATTDTVGLLVFPARGTEKNYEEAAIYASLVTIAGIVVLAMKSKEEKARDKFESHTKLYDRISISHESHRGFTSLSLRLDF
jgi:hypothetical protein